MLNQHKKILEFSSVYLGFVLNQMDLKKIIFLTPSLAM